MKSIFTLIFVSILIGNNLCAQFYFSGQVINLPCSYDSSNLIKSFKYWEMYQTTDDDVNGQRIENCINFTGTQSGRFMVSEIDNTKPLFFKLRHEYRNTDVYKNILINSNYSFVSNNAIFKVGQECFPYQQCSNLTMKFAYPSENGDSLIYKQEIYYPDSSNNHCVISDMFCLPTRNLDNQKMVDAYFTIFFNSQIPNNSYLEFQDFYGYETEATLIVEDVVIQNPTITNDSLKLHLYNLEINNSWSQNYLVVHNEGYPSPSNPLNRKILLEPNESTPINIQLIVDEYESLYLQEFTNLVGGNVEGSDSLHHNLDIVLDGGSMCLTIIEAAFSGGDNFRYKKGELDMSGQTTCMIFHKDSKIIVETNSNLHYGNHGQGMIALDGGEIFLKEKSHLTLDCRVMLKSNQQPNILRMRPESTLRFTENVKLISVLEKLYIQGFRNQVDMDDLDAESKAKIEFIAPINSDFDKPLFLYPNPCTDFIYIPGVADNEMICIYNVQGDLIKKEILSNQILNIDQSLNSGLYFIKYADKCGKIYLLK